MTNWTKSVSSLELPESLRADLEILVDVRGIDVYNISASLDAVDALVERLESLPIPQE